MRQVINCPFLIALWPLMSNIQKQIISEREIRLQSPKPRALLLKIHIVITGSTSLKCFFGWKI